METGRQSVCPDWSIHQSIIQDNQQLFPDCPEAALEASTEGQSVIQDNQQLFPPADVGLMLPARLDQHTVFSTVEFISSNL